MLRATGIDEDIPGACKIGLHDMIKMSLDKVNHVLPVRFSITRVGSVKFALGDAKGISHQTVLGTQTPARALKSSPSDHMGT